MRVRHLLLICLFNSLSAGLFAQNLFPEKINICNTANFCVDCGSPQAVCDSFTLAGISDKINYRYNLKNGFGTITFQVLVNSVGNSCVLSHTDVSHSPLTSDLIIFLNTCIWKPAIVDGKPVNASVNVVFTIANGKISGRMQRLDLSQQKAPGNPTVYNKQYPYRNPSLSAYNFTVLNRYNSPLPDNISQSSTMDKTDILWYGTAHGLTRFDGKVFLPVNESNSPFSTTTNVHNIATDKDNNKWVYADKDVYMFNNVGWQIFDSKQFGISNPYSLLATSSGEIFFPNNKGLLILRNGKMRLINKQLVWQLPSNNVYYAYYDSRDRLWIGTAAGSIMINKKQDVTIFNHSNTPLDNACITNATEDEHGNMYFTLTSCKKTTGDNDQEGIAMMTANGKWTHYNDKNSGMPVNRANSILYDKFEHVLWIGTPLAGLVRFDLKDGWENYHNKNSVMPGYEIRQILQDSKGILYVTTANGLVKMTKKISADTLQ